jgi:hypothetical protein
MNVKTCNRNLVYCIRLPNSTDDTDGTEDINSICLKSRTTDFYGIVGNYKIKENLS